jgi:hypothetical protein
LINLGGAGRPTLRYLSAGGGDAGSRPGDRSSSRPGDRSGSRPGDRSGSRPGDRSERRQRLTLMFLHGRKVCKK